MCETGYVLLALFLFFGRLSGANAFKMFVCDECHPNPPQLIQFTLILHASAST